MRQRHDIPRGCVRESLAALVAEGRRFACVYADPPWCYDNRASRGAAENHYPTMSIADIAALPVGLVAAEAAHLHLWATAAFLFEAIGVVEAWGFEFRDTFVWAKPQLGLGNYWRVSAEFLLLGVRGELPFRDNTVRSWGVYDRTRHSGKPEQVRHIVERVSPGPYLELFGRTAIDGWTVLGDEVQPTLFAYTE